MENIWIKNWKEIQELRSAASRAARREAQAIRWTGDDGRQYRYRFIKPNGFVFYGHDALGDCVYESARCHDAPNTKADFIAEVERLFQEHEEIVTIGIECHYDGAESMHAYWKEGYYDPMVSFGDTGIIAYRKEHTLKTEVTLHAREALAKDLWEAADATCTIWRKPAIGLHLEVKNESTIRVIWNLTQGHTDSDVRRVLQEIRAEFRTQLERIQGQRPVNRFADAFDHYITNA